MLHDGSKGSSRACSARQGIESAASDCDQVLGLIGADAPGFGFSEAPLALQHMSRTVCQAGDVMSGHEETP